MLTVYGGLMPLRLLEEIRFWKTQEKEHTVVIRALAPQLEPEYIHVLQEWEPVFERMELEAGQWIEAVLRSPAGITPYIQMQIEGILGAAIEQSKQFTRQLMIIQNHSDAIKNAPTIQVVILHIMRESEYFLGVLQAFTAGQHHSPDLTKAPVRPDKSTEPSPASSPLVKAFSSATFYPLKQEWKTGEAQAQAHGEPQSDPQTKPEEAPDRILKDGSLTATQEGSWSEALAPEARPVPVGGHTLPLLPYPYHALEPYIDEETMKLHHDKHHQSYVDGLNKAEKMMAEARKSGDFALIKHWEREAAFHGAGHYLHTLFWNVMTPQGASKPSGPVTVQITQDFGGFDAFKKHFSEAAEKVEGGGWAILVWSPRSRRLEILQAEKHQNLSQWDVIPLLALDVWEHAYYLKYQNTRANYIEAWWNVVHWKYVNERFVSARELK